MSNANQLTIAFIGFGEVGQTFARDLLGREGLAIAAHDILVGRPAGAKIEKRAAELGVHLSASAPDAARLARVVISAVTAAEAENVARAARDYLAPGQIFVDVNSAAPATKQRAAKHVEAAGAQYVEAAVMAPVKRPGLAVPILAGGPAAAEAAQFLNTLGMNLTPVATEFGRASAMKLCRSIMIKGLEALMVDCAAACDAFDVRREVFASLAETFPSIDWNALAENMRERVATHGIRRAAEMREAGEMLADIGLDGALAHAVAGAQQRGARPQSES